jgi:hypothetical protein
MDWSAAGFELGWLDGDGDMHRLQTAHDWEEALTVGRVEGKDVLRLRLTV